MRPCPHAGTFPPHARIHSSHALIRPLLCAQSLSYQMMNLLPLMVPLYLIRSVLDPSQICAPPLPGDCTLLFSRMRPQPHAVIRPPHAMIHSASSLLSPFLIFQWFLGSKNLNSFFMHMQISCTSIMQLIYNYAYFHHWECFSHTTSHYLNAYIINVPSW